MRARGSGCRLSSPHCFFEDNFLPVRSRARLHCTQLLVGAEPFDVVETPVANSYIFLQQKPEAGNTCLAAHGKHSPLCTQDSLSGWPACARAERLVTKARRRRVFNSFELQGIDPSLPPGTAPPVALATGLLSLVSTVRCCQIKARLSAAESHVRCPQESDTQGSIEESQVGAHQRGRHHVRPAQSPNGAHPCER